MEVTGLLNQLPQLLGRHSRFYHKGYVIKTSLLIKFLNKTLLSWYNDYHSPLSNSPCPSLARCAVPLSCNCSPKLNCPGTPEAHRPSSLQASIERTTGAMSPAGRAPFHFCSTENMKSSRVWSVPINTLNTKRSDALFVSKCTLPKTLANHARQIYTPIWHIKEVIIIISGELKGF